MAELFLRLAHDPTVLLSAAADGFLRPRSGAREPFPTPSCLLALRQGGVRDDLLSLAARRGVPGWFASPLRTCPERREGRGAGAGAGALHPLDPFERVALIGALVR